MKAESSQQRISILLWIKKQPALSQEADGQPERVEHNESVTGSLKKCTKWSLTALFKDQFSLRKVSGGERERESGSIVLCQNTEVAVLCVSLVSGGDESREVGADWGLYLWPVSFIRREGAEPGGWGRHYGTRIGLAFFLFPVFYLSCHYVSSAVFNDGSSLEAVSGCSAMGGGDGSGGRGTVF